MCIIAIIGYYHQSKNGGHGYRKAIQERKYDNMKARLFAKKLLSAALIAAVIAVAVPLSFSTANAAATVAEMPKFDPAKHTDQSASLTINDAAINKAWKDTGKFSLRDGAETPNTVLFEGIKYTPRDTVYAMITVNWNTSTANATMSPDPDDNSKQVVGFVYGKNSTGYDCTGVRPAWNNLCGLGGDAMFNGGSNHKVTYLIQYSAAGGSVDVYAKLVAYPGRDGYVDEQTEVEYYLGSVSTSNFVFGATALKATRADVTFSDIKVWTDQLPLDNETVVNDMTDNIYLIKGTQLEKGPVVMKDSKNFECTPTGNFGFSSFWFEGIKYDLSDGKSFTFSATIELHDNNKYTESFIGFVPAKVNGDFYRIGLAANGEMEDRDGDGKAEWGPTDEYITAFAPNTQNVGPNAVGGEGCYSGNTIRVKGTKAGAFARLRVVMTADKIVSYINGKQAQVFDISSAESVEPCGFLTFRSIGDTIKVTDLKVYGTALSKTTPELPPAIPDEPVYNSAYDDIADLGTMTGGSAVNGSFGVKGNADFTSVIYEGNYIINTVGDFVVNSRSKQKDGSTTPWSGPRIGICSIDDEVFNISFMAGSTAVLVNGGTGSFSSPGSANFVAKEGEKVHFAQQFNYELMTYNLWINHEHVIINANIPTGTAKKIEPNLSIITEGADVSFSNYKIFGKGVKADLDEETRRIKLDPVFRSTTIPAMPAGGVNYFQNIELVEMDGAGLVAEYIDGVFRNLYSDDTGDVRFVDAQKNRNINGLKNSSTFVWRFKYTFKETDPEYKKEDDCTEFTLRRYSLPSNSKRNDVCVRITKDAISIVRYKDDAASVLTTAKFTRTANKACDIAIVSSPDYTKVWVDGKIALGMIGTGKYTIDLRYKAFHTASELKDIQVYTVVNDSDPVTILDPEYNRVKQTGKTVDEIASVDLPIANMKISVWTAVAGFAAVLCLAGIAVTTVLFIKKRKSR